MKKFSSFLVYSISSFLLALIAILGLTIFSPLNLAAKVQTQPSSGVDIPYENTFCRMV